MRRLEMGIVLACASAIVVLSGCMREPRASAPESRSHVEQVENGGPAIVSVTPRSADRLGIETVMLTREPIMQTKRFVGEVLAATGPTVSGTETSATAGAAAQASSWVVRLELDQADLAELDLERPVTLLPDGPQLASQGVFVAGSNSSVVLVPTEASGSPSPGQRVELHVPVRGGEATRAVVPFGALLYDVYGDAWVYTVVKPWTYQRARVQVGYIDGDNAVLEDAPPDGTDIVSVGAIELFGAEFGVGH